MGVHRGIVELAKEEELSGQGEEPYGGEYEEDEYEEDEYEEGGSGEADGAGESEPEAVEEAEDLIATAEELTPEAVAVVIADACP
jgi:hypothetical protein